MTGTTRTSTTTRIKTRHTSVDETTCIEGQIRRVNLNKRNTRNNTRIQMHKPSNNRKIINSRNIFRLQTLNPFQLNLRINNLQIPRNIKQCSCINKNTRISDINNVIEKSAINFINIQKSETL